MMFRSSLFVLLALAACGPGPLAQPPPPTPPASETSATPPTSTGNVEADKCLAIATAKRDKRPDEPAKVTVKHVLVKYKGSKRAGDGVTRSRGEACLRALEARSKLEAGATIGEVVATYSEEPGAASREGSVGPIARADVAAPFADAAFELGQGDVSHVVETVFGFHIIKRTE